MTLVTSTVFDWVAQSTQSPVVPPADQVTPGFGGFAVIAFLVVVVAILVWDMLRRIRRARYRQEVGAMLDAEVIAKETSEEEATAEKTAEPAPGADEGRNPQP